MAKLKDLLPKKNINESGLSRLVKHMDEHDCGTITAFRSKEGCGGPDDVEYSLDDNKKRNRQLYANLEVLGYGVTRVDGAYIENFGTQDAKEVTEDVYFVVDLKDKGTLKSDLMRLGEKYMQDSILFIPKGGKGSMLIGTNECPSSFPGYRKTQTYNDRNMGKGGEFMTKVKGRPFMFQESMLEQKGVYNYYEVANNMGKWATKTIANGNWKDIQL
jgi:hypothetical protein